MIRLGRGGQDRSAEAWYATNGHIVARKCGRKGLGAGYAPVTGLDARGGPVNRDENPCVPRTPLPRPQCSICCAPFNHRWSAHGLGLFVIAAICLLLLDWRMRLSEMRNYWKSLPSRPMRQLLQAQCRLDRYICTGQNSE